jgi:sugar O-acyltransferase (sialic acid O-acetyltransferase NeuD family)
LVLHELLQACGFEVAAVFDNANIAAPLPGVPLYIGLPGFQHWRASAADQYRGLVAIGGARGQERLQLQRYMSENGVEPMVAVHPRAFVARGVVPGLGSQILAQASVAAAVRLGQACIINHAATVDHECILADGVHVAPGAVLAGCVSVGQHTLIGAGAVVIPRIRIGANVIVGAGAVVTKDVADGTTVAGSPARALRPPPEDFK